MEPIRMFNKINMRSEDLHAMLKDGYFVDANGDAAAVEDGAFVSICDPIAHELYDGTFGQAYTKWDKKATPSPIDINIPVSIQKDLNARAITAYNASEPIYGFVDYVGVNTANVMDVQYRVGDKIAGIGVPAGEHTRVRMVELGDEFYLGKGNFDLTGLGPTDTPVGMYAAPSGTGKTTLTPAASKAASGLVIKIDDSKPLIMGQVNNGVLYRCRVVQL